MRKARNYTVYKHIFPNGKVYIGITSRSVEERWNKGFGYKGQFVGSAINKYGWENVKHEILASNLTKEEAEEMEIKQIAKHKSSISKYGYNIEIGGQTRKKNASARLKNSIAKKGKLSHDMKCMHTKEAIEKASKTRQGAMVNNKPIICVETGNVYSSAGECEEILGIGARYIGKVCRGEIMSTHGLHFRFLKNSDKCYRVYMLTNQIGRHKYVGVTSQPLYFRHKYGKAFHDDQSKLYDAINTFGWDNFKLRVCYCTLDKDLAEKRKQELIKRYNTINDGYNS